MGIITIIFIVEKKKKKKKKERKFFGKKEWGPNQPISFLFNILFFVGSVAFRQVAFRQITYYYK